MSFRLGYQLLPPLPRSDVPGRDPAPSGLYASATRLRRGIGCQEVWLVRFLHPPLPLLASGEEMVTDRPTDLLIQTAHTLLPMNAPHPARSHPGHIREQRDRHVVG
jgi:hypothetical protein